MSMVGFLGVRRRDLRVSEVSTTLRGLAGLLEPRSTTGEHAATRGRSVPRVVEGVDVDAWVGWALVGLFVFSAQPRPSLSRVLGEAQRFLLALLLERTGGTVRAVVEMTGLRASAIRTCLEREVPMPSARVNPWETSVGDGAAYPGKGWSIAELRSLDVTVLERRLREALGVRVSPERSESQPDPGPALREPMLVHDVDIDALWDWVSVGANLFQGGLPSMAALRRESKRFAVSLAMTRSGGNLSQAARMLCIQRKPLREALQSVGLYPWSMPDER